MSFLKPSNKSKKPKATSFLAILIFAFMIFSLASAPRPAHAQAVSVLASIPQVITDVLKKLQELGDKAWKSGGSALYQGLLKNSLNTLAYEAANKIGSGLPGQKPAYEEKAWEDVFADTGNAAIGGFIDSINKQWGVNVCEPDLSVKLKIGLGLKAQSAPPKPSCTWQDLQKNWETEKLKDTFLKNFSQTFEPTNSDLGMAFSLQTNMMEDAESKELAKKEETIAKQGWLDLRNIGGKAESSPKKPNEEEVRIANEKAASIGGVTGDIFVDASNIFLNQLALTAYNSLMAKLTEKGKNGVTGLANVNADPNENAGAAGLRKSLGGILETRFDSRGDYNILGELVSCNATPGGIGPTNCVINDRFSQAIQQKKTVGQAMTEGLLSKDAPFGFQTSGASAIEPSYLEGIPYRSMIILRKFRIIPVGWELAAQKINSDATLRDKATLGYLIGCFSETDSYEGDNASWCKGLVDPDWVLKAPQNFCAKEGYGPQIISKQVVDQGIDVVTYDDKNSNGLFDTGDRVNSNGASTTKIKLSPKLVISRLDTYCADEQSCIKEKNDGSCEYYGYCTEERRKWNFGVNSCEPVYNSCQTYKGETGETSSYLKNTLAFCDQENFGCERYAKGGLSSYVVANSKNDWSKNDGYAFFNKNIESCEAEGEGCHEFLRFRTGVGTNLIRNSGFEQNNAGDAVNVSGWIGDPAEPFDIGSAATVAPEKFWMVTGSFLSLYSGQGRPVIQRYSSIIDAAPGRGGKVLQINSSVSPAALYSFDRSGAGQSVLPQGFVMEPETSYTLSADIYIESGDKVILEIGRDSNYWQKKEITVKGFWTRESVTIKNNKDILANEFRIVGSGSTGVSFYIDNIQFEVGNKATTYNDYRQKNLIYQKFLPKYLEAICYFNWEKSDYRLKADAPAVCRQYARKCSRDEANCEMYSSTNGAKIPAAVTDKDYCTAECNGFDAYIQTKNNFNSLRTFFFIPKTAKECSASEVGCEEFTNLDKSAEGGESREYYSYLRQCVKPNTSGNTCASFYTWEGNNEQGEQLSMHSLKADANGRVSLTDYSNSDCASIFGLPPSNPQYNPDCRRFTNQAGEVFYRYYSRTISCTQDCHPYRLSNKNVVERAVTKSACIYDTSETNPSLTPTGHWDASANLCYFCENGGYWSTDHNSCIYNAAPQESISCSASAKGCAEFNGNQGNNVRQIFLSTFENGFDNWVKANGAPDPSIEQVAISGKKSLSLTGPIEYNVGGLVAKNGSYTLSFVAKLKSGTSAFLMAAFYNGQATSTFRANASSTDSVRIMPNNWGVYQLNLASLGHEPKPDEKLRIYFRGVADAYIDNVKLSVIAERYYLIRDSWNTPASCDQDENGKPYPLYMLGCSEYKDRLGNTHYLHRFSRLCQESAVGCEAMIDTQNSVKQSSEYYGTGVGTLVPSDWVTYAVYDPAKKCQTADKGCERFGLAKGYENSYTYSDVFQKNNPDKYSSILCTAEGVGCDKWASTDGDAYFKDPGDMVCEWRVGKVSGRTAQAFAWFKKKVKRCNGEGEICSSDTSCTSGQACKLDTREIVCPSTQYKTFGQGGVGNEVYQPEPEAGFNWVGLCSADQSGCTEYVDPVSDFSTNIIYNPDFKQNTSGNADHNGDGWENVTIAADSRGRQRILLEGNTAYILTVEGNNLATTSARNFSSTDFRPFHILGPDNKLSSIGTNQIVVGASSSVIFYVNQNAEATTTVAIRRPGSKVTLKKVVTDYQLSQEVDKNSCNGIANLSAGCVYFNERSIIGALGLSPLNANAWTGYGSDINVNDGGLTEVKNSNQLVKVAADRVCNKWLSCKTYVKGDDNKPVCFDIADCDRLDKGGNCANFPVLKDAEVGNRTYGVSSQENIDTIKNLSGYTKVGYEQGVDNKFTTLPNNLFNLGIMNQFGTEIKVSNGNFEFNNRTYDGTQYVYTPSGWSPYTSSLDLKDSAGMFDVIQDPVSAQKAGVGYPAEGVAFLRYNAANPSAAPFSDSIRITRGQEYYLSYMINTTGLIGGSAKVDVFERDIKTPLLPSPFITPSSMDWHVETHIVSSTNSDLINIRLGATAGSGGYVYIDDVKVSPVLKIKDSTDTYVNQSCRLYPKEDSLSCDYTDDAGMRQKGDFGYCLEYDRAPGNPNTCLMWWPIDKVSGQGGGKAVKSATVYPGPAPLFYCVAGPYKPHQVDSDNNGSADKTIDYPYMLASDMSYAVDESMYVKINGTTINKDEKDGRIGEWNSTFSRDDQRGAFYDDVSRRPRNFDIGSPTVYSSVIDNIIPLKYGINTIEVMFEADTVNGPTFLRFSGNYHYVDNTESLISKPFDFVQMFKDFRNAELGHTKTKNYPDGSKFYVEFSCGENDSRVQVRTCNLSKKYINITGFDGSSDREYITNSNEKDCGAGFLCDATGGAGNWIKMTYSFFVSEPACDKVAQVVDRNGANKVWVERFKQSSGYSLNCNSNVGMSAFALSQKQYANAEGKGIAVNKATGACYYTADASPFGSIAPPGTTDYQLSDPASWGDLNKGTVDAQGKIDSRPLLYTGGIGPRMGQLHSPTTLSYLFAESFGIWDWNPDTRKYVINNNSPLRWPSPKILCEDNKRSEGKFQNCSVRPDISNIKLNAGIDTAVFGRGFVNLTFNSKVDPQQAPLTSYEVDWGDTEKLTVSGQDMKDMPNQDTPHSVYHSYDYWDLLGKYRKSKTLNNNANDIPTLTCLDKDDDTHPQDYCLVRPKVKIKDNWGWCSEGTGNNSCPSPATATCVDRNVPVIKEVSKIETRYCRNYSPSLPDGGNVCESDTPICSDGYWESQGDVVVYKY